MASRWLPIILALEIESAGWQANSSVGDTQAYPRDEHCQSSVGSAFSSLRLAAGSRSLDTSFGLAMAHTERYLSAAFDRSAFETARRLRVHPGKTHTPNGWSARSAGNASTISWCSANAICAMCCCPTWTTIMARALTYR